MIPPRDPDATREQEAERLRSFHSPKPAAGSDLAATRLVDLLAEAYHSLASHGGPLTPCGYINAAGEYVKVAYNQQPPEDEYACMCESIIRGTLTEYAHLLAANA